MLSETGNAVVRLDKDGSKYWHTYDEGSKEGVDVEVDEPLKLFTGNFKVGTTIRIYEDV